MTDHLILAIRQRWTSDRRAELKLLWEDGMSTGDIASALGCSPGAIIAETGRRGFRRPPWQWTKAKEVELRDLWLSVLTTGAIAERLGVTRSSVCGKARRLGLPMRDRSNIRGEKNPNWRGGLSARRAASNIARRAERAAVENYPRPSAHTPGKKKKPGRLCFRLGIVDRFSE